MNLLSIYPKNCLLEPTKLFLIVLKWLPWHQARAHCQSLGGELASFHSRAELELVANMRRDRGIKADRFWIGLNDVDEEGNFKWSDATAVNFSLWNPGEPNNHFNEDCAGYVFPPDGTWWWNDYTCAKPLAMICKFLHA